MDEGSTGLRLTRASCLLPSLQVEAEGGSIRRLNRHDVKERSQCHCQKQPCNKKEHTGTNGTSRESQSVSQNKSTGFLQFEEMLLPFLSAHIQPLSLFLSLALRFPSLFGKEVLSSRLIAVPSFEC